MLLSPKSVTRYRTRIKTFVRNPLVKRPGALRTPRNLGTSFAVRSSVAEAKIAQGRDLRFGAREVWETALSRRVRRSGEKVIGGAEDRHSTLEARGAASSEIDLERGKWVIPEERMKIGKEHRIPLSAPALAQLNALP
ncbi:MAG: hypothetical protein ACK47S_20870 [Paracoccaceae bacterium]